MSQGNPQGETPWGPRPVGYQPAAPKSQWATDDHAFTTCLVYGAIVLSVIGAVLGGVLWFFWEAVKLLFS